MIKHGNEARLPSRLTLACDGSAWLGTYTRLLGLLIDDLLSDDMQFMATIVHEVDCKDVETAATIVRRRGDDVVLADGRAVDIHSIFSIEVP